jgi:hypothetical protein
MTLWRLLKGESREHSTPVKGPVTLTGSIDTVSTEDAPQRAKADGGSKPLALRSLLVPRVIIAAGNYAALSFLDIAFRAVQPVFFATPLELGGLGLDPPRIGNILAIYGVINGLFQIFFFADLHDRFGSKTIYSVSMAAGIPMIITLPILNAVARVHGLSLTVWAIVGVQLALSVILNLAYCQCLHHVTVLCVDHEPPSLRIYLHRRGLSKPGLSWRNEWDCSVGCFDRTSDRPRIRHVHVLALYQEPPPRMDSLLLSDCPCLHGYLHVAVTSPTVVEESPLTSLTPRVWFNRGRC